MGRPIDENSVIDIVMYECGEWSGLAKEITKQITMLPSAEPQIRCKDCKHHGYDRRDLPYCDINDYGYGWKDEDFCSYAERRQDG